MSPVASKINFYSVCSLHIHFCNIIKLLGSSSCVIKESDLNEGVRVLVKLDGHFYPGKILAISPPDIYGILVDRERGNRPHIFSREEVLKEAVSKAVVLWWCIHLLLNKSLNKDSQFLYIRNFTSDI